MGLIRVSRATDDEFELAEGVLWDDRLRVLHWVDLTRGIAYEGRLGSDGAVSISRRRRVDTSLGAVVLTETEGEVIAVGRETLMVLRPETSPVELVRILPQGGRLRLNDAAADPVGRLLVGSAARVGEHRGNALWSWTVADGVRVLREDVTLSNGIGFAPTGDVIYHVDSKRHRVDRAAYDPTTGTAHGWAALIEVEGGHQPDGLTVDADGSIWVAIWGAGQVRRHSPQGELLDAVEVPAARASNAVFAGTDLRTLVISSARAGMREEQLAQQPDAGALFAARTAVAGLPPYRVRLE